MKFREMTKEQRDRTVLKGLLLVAAVVAFYWFGIRPLSQQIHAREQQIETLNQRIQGAEQLIRRETQIRDEARRLHQSLRQTLGQHLPPDENPLLWATQIAYRHAAAHGLEVRAISEETTSTPFWLRSAQPPPRSTGSSAGPAAWRSFAPYVVQITLDASFPDILLLIAALEKEQPMLNISVISLQADPRNPELVNARLSLQWPRRLVPLDSQVQDFLGQPFPPEETP